MNPNQVAFFFFFIYLFILDGKAVTLTKEHFNVEFQTIKPSGQIASSILLNI